ICARRPWVVMGVWALVVAGIVGLVVTVGPETSNDLNLPGTESQKAQDLLRERFPPQQNGANPVVFHVATGKLSADKNKDAIGSSVKALRKAPHVVTVTGPFSDAGQTAGLVSKNGRTAFAPVLLDI